MGTPTASELVEWVDDDGRVLAVVTRGRMRAHRLLHRSVFVVVRSPAGEVLVHRRADWKDVWPAYWDLAFGGVVGVGESWVEAASRELAEEAGLLTAELTELGDFRYTDAQVAELARVFTATSPGPFRFADGEVTATEWVGPTQIEGWLAEHPVCPDSLHGVLPLLAASAGAG